MRTEPESLLSLIDLQAGVLTAAQAHLAGLGAQEVRRRLRSGRWQVMHFGVYAAFSGQPGRDAVLWAVVLRAGAMAMLSHHTAAELDGLTDDTASLLHVTIPESRHIWPIPGVSVHRTEHAAVRRHPVRTPPRTRVEETVLDLTELAESFDAAYGWVTRAVGRRLTTLARLQDAAAGRARLRWRGELRQVLTADWDGIHSGLEYRYVRDVERAHQLPGGTRQARALVRGQTRYRDVLYEGFNVAVELDGQVAHPGDTRWRDISRDNAAAADGIITLRYGWLDVSRDPCGCAAQVALTLSRRGPVRCRPCSPGCPVPPLP